MNMKTLLLASLSAAAGVHAAPLALHPDNPHYFLFREKPTVLITSAEHYGAVLNLDFDYVKYLDALAADGLNLNSSATVEGSNKKTLLTPNTGVHSWHSSVLFRSSGGGYATPC